MGTNAVIPAEKRIDGMYGEIWVAQQWWADVVEITGTITVERKPVNPAGTTQTYNKRGRVTREGTFRVDKADSRHERDFINNVNRSLADRRANRNVPWFPKFNMVVVLDDPDAWGREQIQLMNCEIWTMPVGYSLTEMVMREIQFTWEFEDTQSMQAISAPGA